MLRLRCDGIYVGECCYAKERAGPSLLGATGFGSRFIWCTYRRYLRFFPPEDGIQLALVLRDACPQDIGEAILMDFDPRSHVNPHDFGVKVSTEMRSSAAQANSTKAQ